MFEEREREEDGPPKRRMISKFGFVGVAVVDIIIIVFDERRNDLRIIIAPNPCLLLLLLKGCCCCRCRCDWSLSKSVPRCNIYYYTTKTNKCINFCRFEKLTFFDKCFLLEKNLRKTNTLTNEEKSSKSLFL